ncbi:MAG: hypothetical protein FWF13_03270 [Acidobacteria bacterium]|nr:hypothetical protein [Acidobacteriota bacterium]
MRIKTVTIAVASVILLLGLSACQQGTETAGKDQASYSRADLERYVDRYMDAMLTKNVDPALFAKNVRFTENGVELPLGAEGLWSNMVGKGTYKFYVPDVEINQVAFMGTAREESNTDPEGDLVAVALRLKIVNGLITEAEQLVTRPEGGLNPGGGPARGAGFSIERMGAPRPAFFRVIPEANRPSRESMITVANKYFSGLQKNDGKGDYPFADDCHRIENGSPATNVPLREGQTMPDPKTATGYSANWTCTEQFNSGLMYFVTRIRDRRFVAVDREHGNVFSFGYFDHAAGDTRNFTTPDGRNVTIGPISPWTWQIAEIFQIRDNQISQIEATLHRVPYGMNSGWSTFEKGWSDEIQIVK